MSIFLTGYDTTAGRGYNTEGITLALKHSIIQSNFPDKNNLLNGVDVGNASNPAVALLSLLTLEEVNVPPLIFPMFVDTGSPSTRKSESYTVVDIRPFLANNQLSTGNSLNIRQKDNYEFFVVNGILTNAWINSARRSAFKFLGVAPMAVYSSMISNALERRFALDPSEQLKIAIVAAAFYYRLFDEGVTISEHEVVSVTKAIASATRAPVDMIYSVLDDILELKNLDDLINTIKKVIDNPRLDSLNLGTMVTIINSMWYGPYGHEMILASLEHPPTWLTILYSAFTDRSMKHSGVATVADRYKGSKGGDDFIRNMKILVANAKTEV
jgi:hypothetical protein